MEQYKTDCYYYTEVHDMGACISQCKRYRQLGKCPCDNCTDYISHKEVRLAIQDYMRNKKCKKEPKTDMLDKIRAEIEQRKKNSGGEPNRDLAFNVCLQIINKYKESEE